MNSQSLNPSAVIVEVHGVDSEGKGDIAGITYDVAVNVPGQASYTLMGLTPDYRPVQPGVVVIAFPVGMSFPVQHFGTTIRIGWSIELPPIENCPE